MTAFTPLAITAGVEVWTAILKQSKEAEVTIFGEITSGWLETIRKNKGLFNTSMKYVRDLFHAIVQHRVYRM